MKISSLTHLLDFFSTYPKMKHDLKTFNNEGKSNPLEAKLILHSSHTFLLSTNKTQKIVLRHCPQIIAIWPQSKQVTPRILKSSLLMRVTTQGSWLKQSWMAKGCNCSGYKANNLQRWCHATKMATNVVSTWMYLLTLSLASNIAAKPVLMPANSLKDNTLC